MMPHCTRNALIVGAGSLISRLLGFARDASFAWLLGGSATADAVSVALRLPYMIRRLFGEGTLSLALTTACAKEGHGETLAAAVTRYMAFWSLIIVLILMLFAREAIFLTAPGFCEALLADTSKNLDEAILLFRIAAPYMLFAMLAAGKMAAFHSREHFLLPSLAPAAFNCMVLASAALAVCVPHQDAGMILVCGVLLGGIAQWGILCGTPPPKTAITFAPDLIRTVARRMPAGILGAAMPQLAFLIAAILTSMLPQGHMAALFYAERLLEFPLGVLGAAAGIAVAPRLARLARLEDQCNGHPLRLETARAMHLSLMLTLPATAGLFAVAEPLVSITLGHGAFTPDAIHATTLALYAYLPGLPAYALSRPLLAACHSLDDTGTPARIALISLCVTALVGGLLMTCHHILTTTAILPALTAFPVACLPPLAVSIGLWWNVILIQRCLARHIPFGFPIRPLIRPFFGAVATFLVASGSVLLGSDAPHWVRLACAVPAGMLTYAACLVLFAPKKRTP